MNKCDEKKMIFVVGNPRSGTTMLGLMLGRNIDVHVFHELHYFDKLWDPQKSTVYLSGSQSKKLEQNLWESEAKTTLKHRGREDNLMPDEKHFQADKKEKHKSTDLYQNFLFSVTTANNKTIPCEQTPGYLYYVNEIQDIFPNSLYVNIFRDPRSILLSQKKKWKSQSLKKENPALFEKIRLWVNYHPITTSLIWRAAIKQSFLQSKNKSFYSVKYEDIVRAPEGELRKICNFLGIEFSDEMLRVSRAGSSIINYGDKEKGVDFSRQTEWLRDGLSATEIFICQKINKKYMKDLGYDCKQVRPNSWSILLTLATFPIKLFMTFVLHLFHFKNLGVAIKRRLL